MLSWWNRHQNILPLLAKFARTILAIPASSAKSERVFSIGGFLVNARRTNLNPSKVEQLIIIKENRQKVAEFKENGGYIIEETGSNAFLKINFEVILADEDKEGEGSIVSDTENDLEFQYSDYTSEEDVDNVNVMK